jgi:hypothetical protein
VGHDQERPAEPGSAIACDEDLRHRQALAGGLLLEHSFLLAHGPVRHQPQHDRRHPGSGEGDQEEGGPEAAGDGPGLPGKFGVLEPVDRSELFEHEAGYRGINSHGVYRNGI